MRSWHQVLPLLLSLGLWEIGARWLLEAGPLPPPSAIAARAVVLLQGPLLQAILDSLARLLFGLALGGSAGLLLGLGMGLRPSLDALLRPGLSALMAVPTIAWVPVLLVITGLGETTVVATVALGVVFVIAFTARDGLQRIDRNVLRFARSLHPGRCRMLCMVLLPAALPALIGGCRLGLAYGWRALVGGEMLAALLESGLGFMVFRARAFGDIATMCVGVATIAVFGLLFERSILQTLERRCLQRWGMLDRNPGGSP